MHPPSGWLRETDANQILELGKYAHEDEMPTWLVRLLETKGELRAGGKGISSNQLREL